MPKDLVVILTALNLEYQAVHRKLAGAQVHRHERGTLFEVGTVQGTSCRVALGLTSKGNHSAAVIAERAVQEFSPVAVLFVGVAGALWDTAQAGRRGDGHTRVRLPRRNQRGRRAQEPPPGCGRRRTASASSARIWLA
ncbi:hypothetical protein GCM10023238_07650 [Streptomyces heliomycini]